MLDPKRGENKIAQARLSLYVAALCRKTESGEEEVCNFTKIMAFDDAEAIQKAKEWAGPLATPETTLLHVNKEGVVIESISVRAVG